MSRLHNRRIVPHPSRARSFNITPVSTNGRLNLPGVSPDLFDALYNRSRQSMSANEALGIPTFWRCVNILSSIPAILPLKVYQRKGASRTRVYSHPCLSIFNRSPDGGDTNAEIARRGWGVQKILYGNLIAEVIRNGRQEVVQLLGCPYPGYNMYRETDRRKWYQLTAPDSITRYTDPLPPQKIFHVAGFSIDGFIGRSPVSVQADLLERSALSGDAKTEFLRKGGRPSGILSSEARRLTPEIKDEMRNEWNESLPNGLAILSNGTKYIPISLPPDDKMFLDGIKWDALLICLIMGVPPYMVGIYPDSRDIKAEEMALHFLINTVLTEVRAYEAEINLRCLPSDMEAELDLYHLLRASYSTQAEFYRTMVSIGGMLPDEVREATGRDAHTNGMGAVPLIGGNNFIRLEDVISGKTLGSGQQSGQQSGDPNSGKDPLRAGRSNANFAENPFSLSEASVIRVAAALEHLRGKSLEEVEKAVVDGLA